MERPAFTIGIEEGIPARRSGLLRAGGGAGGLPRGLPHRPAGPGQPRVQAVPGRDRHPSLPDHRSRPRRPAPAALHDLPSRRAATGSRRSPHPVIPFSDWKHQHHTDRERYHGLERDLAGVARRLLICGCHVHIGIDDNDAAHRPAAPDALLPAASARALDLIAVLAGRRHRAGLVSHLRVRQPPAHRPTAGLPELRRSCSDRWACSSPSASSRTRPRSGGISGPPTTTRRSRRASWTSHRARTMPSRSPRVTQCLLRMLWRLRTRNQRWRIYDRFLIGENRWRAQRYGVTEGLIDFGANTIVPFPQLMAELVEMIAEDADALDCRRRGGAGAHHSGSRHLRPASACGRRRGGRGGRRSGAGHERCRPAPHRGVPPRPVQVPDLVAASGRSRPDIAVVRRRAGAGQLSCEPSTQARYSSVTVPVTYRPSKQLMSRSSTSEPSRIAAFRSSTSW